MLQSIRNPPKSTVPYILLQMILAERLMAFDSDRFSQSRVSANHRIIISQYLATEKISHENKETIRASSWA